MNSWGCIMFGWGFIFFSNKNSSLHDISFSISLFPIVLQANILPVTFSWRCCKYLEEATVSAIRFSNDTFKSRKRCNSSDGLSPISPATPFDFFIFKILNFLLSWETFYILFLQEEYDQEIFGQKLLTILSRLIS